jgi:hypothetical protein
MDHAAASTWIGGSTSRRSACGTLLQVIAAEIHISAQDQVA